MTVDLSKYLVDYDYEITPEHLEDIREMAANMHGTERAQGRDIAELERAASNTVLEYALAEALDLRKLTFQGAAADVIDPENNLRIDVKRQIGLYFERPPSQIGSLWDNRFNIDVIVTGNFKMIEGRIARCQFKQAFEAKSLFNMNNSEGNTWQPSRLFRLSMFNNAPFFKKDKQIHWYDHINAEAAGKGVYRPGLCAIPKR